MYERMLNKAVVPSYEDMIKYCKEWGDSFDKFNEWVAEKFKAEGNISFPYGNMYGWCRAFHCKGKLVCNVFPENGAFCVMVRRSDKQFESVYPNISEYGKGVIDKKYPCGSGGWVRFRVISDESLDDCYKIMQSGVKRPYNRKQQ